MGEPGAVDARTRRFGSGASLRRATARGTLINGAFLAGVNGLSMLRGFIVAGFLTTAEYGVWGTVLSMLAVLFVLKQIGITDKYIQQDEDDQVRAYHVAFTFELVVTSGFAVLGTSLMVGAAVVYGHPEVLAPGLVLLLSMPALALQFPLAHFYRRMDFRKQRTLQAVDPLTAFVVTIALAVAGAGYWSMVIGTVAGAFAGAAAALANQPYRPKWVFDRSQVRGYFGFSWPILVAGLSAIVTGQGLLAIGQTELGLAGVGIIALVAQVSQVTDRADKAITDTMYPAICAVQGRVDLLMESFTTSNRLALMWAIPFGAGLALFADDLLVRVMGPEWADGVSLLQATAVALAIHQIGFNWTAFYRARGDTTPIAWAGLVGVVTFLVLVLPLTLSDGLDGLGLAVLLAELVYLPLRLFFLRRIFPRLDVVRHVARALLPSVLPVLVVLAARELHGGDGRTLGRALVEASVYALLTAACTIALERPLLREAIGYLRGRQPLAGAA